MRGARAIADSRRLITNPIAGACAGGGGARNDANQMRSGDIEFAKVGSSTLIVVESLRGLILRRRSPQGPTTAPIDASDKVPAGKLPTGARSTPLRAMVETDAVAGDG